MSEIENGIKCLVDVLNQTGICETFSSCEGHFEPEEQDPYNDRLKAEVRFYPSEGTSKQRVEELLVYLTNAFRNDFTVDPIKIVCCRYFTDDINDEIYSVELRPFNRFEHHHNTRGQMDYAILEVTRLVQQFIELN